MNAKPQSTPTNLTVRVSIGTINGSKEKSLGFVGLNEFFQMLSDQQSDVLTEASVLEVVQLTHQVAQPFIKDPAVQKQIKQLAYSCSLRKNIAYQNHE